MTIYFVRTSALFLNRSFRHIADAKKYIQKLKRDAKTAKLDIKLLLNGAVI